MTQTKPIPFSAPMVQALLREIEAPGMGKTQTRRIFKVRGPMGVSYPVTSPEESLIELCDNELRDHGTIHYLSTGALSGPYKCPYGKPGDLLYVRERWSGEHWFSNIKPSDRLLMPNANRLVSLIPETWYWADGSPSSGDWEKPRPGMHMPRWASRFTLEVTDVEVQRLNSVKHSQLLNEVGLSDALEDEDSPAGRAFSEAEHYAIAGVPMKMSPEMFGYAAWWDSRHSRGSFESNPWVWAVTFTPHLTNVDEFIKGRTAA